ncbi:MAG: hypothetical protein U1E65_07950 [Myxococcota bacterium]
MLSLLAWSLLLAQPGPTAGGDDLCRRCRPPRTTGLLAHPKIKEASGLAASAIHPGVFYVHNDAGDRPRFFAIDQAGRDLGMFDVEGAPLSDWEDAAVGPCPAGSCLYIADTGETGSRADYAILRIPEPSEIGRGHHPAIAERFVFRYPDGQHDAESLFVHPKTGVLTLVTKHKKKPSVVFELELSGAPGAERIAKKVGELRPAVGVNKLTGGSVRPDARGLLLRSYSHLFYYPLQPTQTVAEALLHGPACFLSSAEPSGGEAVAWVPREDAFLTLSEGRGSEVHRFDCAKTSTATGQGAR